MAQPKVPEFLYHGSFRVALVLRPGIHFTDKLEKWDEYEGGYESNEFLYATEDRNLAIEMSFASWVDSRFKMKHFHSEGDLIRITFQKFAVIPSRSMIERCMLYLYKIHTKPQQCWVKVNNPVNNAQSEWKSPAVIKSVIGTEKILAKEWLATKQLELVSEA